MLASDEHSHAAYSHKWQGLSQANPEYEAKDMEKALLANMASPLVVELSELVLEC